MKKPYPTEGRVAEIMQTHPGALPGSLSADMTRIVIEFKTGHASWHCAGRPGLRVGQKVRIDDYDKMMWSIVDKGGKRLCDAMDIELAIDPKFYDRANEYSRAVNIAILRGRFEEARRLVNDCEAAYEESCARRKLMSQDHVFMLEQFGVQQRVLNKVMASPYGIRTIGGLVAAGPSHIRSLPGVNVDTVNKLGEALKDAGHEWK